MHTIIEQPALYVMLATVSVAAVSDWKTGIIPNRVSAAGAGLGVLVQFLAVAAHQAPLATCLARMGLGLLACTILPLTLYLLGGMGGGDLKLFAAIGLCVGPSVGLDIQVLAHLVAVLALPLYFLRHGGLLQALASFVQLVRSCVLSGARRPELGAPQLASFRFAPAILVASVLVALTRGGVP